MDDVLYVSATPGDYELEHCGGEVIEQVIRPTGLLDPIIEVRDAKGQVDDMLGEIRRVVEQGHRVLITTLTKKLSEELTNYYAGVGVRVKYLHSEIDAIERIKILRDLRLGEFDVLVGITLLREGLDLPEVALVGIMDADKEGFLRSTRSLIQTIGRAARNSEGRVLLYAYKVTKSMQQAIDITKQRREKQDRFNQENNITPTTIAKRFTGGVIELLEGQKGQGPKKKNSKLFNETKPKDLEVKINQMTVEMKKAAKEMRFEDAARLRDEIKALKEFRLIL
jgi:excinuclease ABC subunit B